MRCTNCGNKLNEGEAYCASCGKSGLQLNPPEQTVSAPPPVTVSAAPTYQAASISARIANTVLDSIFQLVLYGVIIFAGNLIPSDTIQTIFLILAVFMYCLYYVITEAVWQRTIAKLITKTKVVDLAGGKPSLAKIIGRSFARLIPFDWFSFVFNSHPHGWHDSLSGTIVVPASYTPEQVQQIEKKSTSMPIAATVAIIAVLSLVFIAIIGIVSAVVLASLNTAREKGNVAAIESNMSAARTQAAIYYEINGGYTGFCASPEVTTLLENSTCNDSKDAWAIAAKLTPDSFYCGDSYPNDPVEINRDLAKGEVSCPFPDPLNDPTYYNDQFNQ